MDPKAEVFEGRAGTGAAFILPDAWKTPLALGNQYAREDGAARARAAALKAKQEADQKKAADAALKDLTTIDTSKAWDIDQSAIRDKYNGLIQYAAQQQAAGKPVGDARNTEQWATAQRMRKDIQDAASASMQQQARWAELGKVVEADKDGIYDKQQLEADLSDYKATPFADRLRKEVNLRFYFNPGKAIAAIQDKVDQEVTTSSRFTGRANTTEDVKDTAYNAKQHQLIAQQLLAMPGATETAQAAYDALPPEQRALPGNRSFATFAQNWAEGLSRESEGKKHEVKLNYRDQWHGFAPSAADTKAARDAQNEKDSVTALLKTYNGLKNGAPGLFTGASQDHPGLLESNQFSSGIVLGKQEVKTAKGEKKVIDNVLQKVLRDPASGELFMQTSASKKLIPITDGNAFEGLLRHVSGKDAEALKRVMVKNGLSDNNGAVITRGLGNDVTPEEVERQRQLVEPHRQAGVKARALAAADLFDESAKYPGVRALPGADEDSFGKGTTPTQVIADRLNTELRQGTLKAADGQPLRDAQVVLSKVTTKRVFGKNSDNAELRLKYLDAKGKQVTTEPMTREALRTLLNDGFTPSARKAAGAAPAARGASAAAAGRATTAVTGSGKSHSSSSSNTGGAY